MRKSKIARIAGFTVALGATASLVGFAASGTGAYFSDSAGGHITGTVGSIHVSVIGGSGATNSDFAFDRLLPGTPQTITISYTNTGNSPEDVFVTFPNATALSALNDLGTYGSVQVNNAQGQDVFDSTNLNDNSTSCGPFSHSGCNPLPNQLKVDSGLAPGGSDIATFSFGYPSKLHSQAPVGTTGVWNSYPIAAGLYNQTTNPGGQFTVNGADGTGNGLPYAIVATQVGQTP
jgi:hypothetical protein